MENQETGGGGDLMKTKRGLRIILFPLPYQGHINPMLQLANILHSTGFTITIIHTQFNAPNPSNYPHFHFCPLPQTSPEKNPDGAVITGVIDIITNFNKSLVGPFRDHLIRMIGDESSEPIGCLITDAHWYFTQDIANSFGIRRIVLRTSNLSSVLVFVAYPLFHDRGYLSNQGLDLDASVPEFPELKIKDVSKIYAPELSDHVWNGIDKMFRGMKASSATVWNTFAELEQPVLDKINQYFSIPVFTIGPFHKYFPASGSSLIEQDKSSIAWLESQPPKSVLYVSFGSLAGMEESEFLEMAWGLANSMQPFIWVVRPGMISGPEWMELFPNELMMNLSGRGRIVKWAPQQEILSHPSTGGFWTHCGWNSTLESICEGVPMICSPCFGDQPMDARYVSQVWKVGIQLENGFERGEIEKAIKRIFVEEEGEEIRENIMELKKKVDVCLKPGGSSYNSLQSLVTFILS